MDDVSNKTVVALLIATIVISLGGAYVSLNAVNNKLSSIGLSPITGFATTVPNGTATLTVSLVSSIQFSQPTVAFDTGSINTSIGNCTLSTVAANSGGCVDFSAQTNGFTIENDGNTNLSVTLLSDLNAADFIGDGAALFLWNVSVNESGSCVNATGDRLTVEPNTTNAGCGGETSDCGGVFEAASTTTKNICPSLLSDDASDALNIDINVSIPVTAPSGSKSAKLTIYRGKGAGILKILILFFYYYLF